MIITFQSGMTHLHSRLRSPAPIATVVAMPPRRTAVPDSDTIFATNLRTLREVRGLSLASLSAASGVPATAIYRSERIDRKTSIGEAQALATALDVPLLDMISRRLHPRTTINW